MPAPTEARASRQAVVHIVGDWQHWLDRLGLKVPRALCGAYLAAEGPDDGPDQDAPVCDRCERRASRHSLAELVRARCANRRARAATADRWAEAATFEDLCGLTAQWLEGELAFHPGGYDEPDPETTELLPVLADLNRIGFLTEASQPGATDPGYDGAGWQQRAAVQGYVTDETLRRVLALTAQTHGLLYVVHDPSDRIRQDAVVVTTRAGRPYTVFGVWLPPSNTRMTYGSWCSREIGAVVNQAHQVTLIDPEWGREDVLWPALTELLQPHAD
ncbi:hypothetical protein E0H75_42410 [Kribbella capetownensis]|uniref:DUF6919 domain-containing protein n=1 Tax=Kribbella capetownensis TaxID=1572659 RepID=A0A4R0INA7_9ACTN|nr:hypothetical protein [Kribbella capetownensis]TCC33910.1 hypothetical protein E0H75_42410 [Kribbella capetownensis]